MLVATWNDGMFVVSAATEQCSHRVGEVHVTETGPVYLAHVEPDVAESIHRVMMAAYRVEADLLGVTDFVPMHRTPEQIAGADSVFFGYFVQNELAATTEGRDSRPATGEHRSARRASRALSHGTGRIAGAARARAARDVERHCVHGHRECPRARAVRNTGVPREPALGQRTMASPW